MTLSPGSVLHTLGLNLFLPTIPKHQGQSCDGGKGEKQTLQEGERELHDLTALPGEGSPSEGIATCLHPGKVVTKPKWGWGAGGEDPSPIPQAPRSAQRPADLVKTALAA